MANTPNPAFHKVNPQDSESLRSYWLRWLAYKFRGWPEDEYDEWIMFHDVRYREWCKEVLGREKTYWPYQEALRDYVTVAIDSASLPQLQQLIAVRYEEAHPVRDGWTQAYRATLCQPCRLAASPSPTSPLT